MSCHDSDSSSRNVCHILAALLATSSWALADEVRIGKAAYGDWQTDAPGVMRKITANDLNPPLETPSTANRSKVVAKPTGAKLQTMPGFSVAPFVTDMEGARVIRVAPDGDIFVARRRPEGKVMVIRTKPGADKPDVVETFVSGLKDPYGIAFYPPGPDPKWIYIAGTRDIVRYPYNDSAVSVARNTSNVIFRPIRWLRSRAQFCHSWNVRQHDMSRSAAKCDIFHTRHGNLFANRSFPRTALTGLTGFNELHQALMPRNRSVAFP